MFRICGDNIDKGVKQRYMRVGVKKPDSLHWFHAYAVSDRIDFSNLSEQVIPTSQICPDRIAASLLPSVEDDLAIRRNICTLMSRVLCDNVTFFKASFDGVVDRHIKHDFYDQMSKKSDVVSKYSVSPYLFSLINTACAYNRFL